MSTRLDANADETVKGVSFITYWLGFAGTGVRGGRWIISCNNW